MTLNRVAMIVREFDERNITYCHWKSNAALEKAALGEDDLDLLFEVGREEDVGEVLRSAGFVECCTAEFRRTVGIQDYLSGHA